MFLRCASDIGERLVVAGAETQPAPKVTHPNFNHGLSGAAERFSCLVYLQQRPKPSQQLDQIGAEPKFGRRGRRRAEKNDVAMYSAGFRPLFPQSIFGLCSFNSEANPQSATSTIDEFHVNLSIVLVLVPYDPDLSLPCLLVLRHLNCT